MRILHCTVALVLIAGLAGAAPQAEPAGPGASNFTLFLRGIPIGTEEVSVTRTSEGTTISGSARLGPPLSITVRRVQIRYAPDGRPLDCLLEGSIQDRLLGLRTTIADNTATTDITQGTERAHVAHPVSPTTVVLPNAFLGSYEALAARLLTAKPGDELKAYIPGQPEMAVQVMGGSEETIRTPAGQVTARRVAVQLRNPSRPVDGEVWADPTGRLLRFTVAAQSLDYARNDIVSVASRREPVSHPGDEQVRMRANGFDLAGTLSKPTAAVRKGVRLPAIVLVPTPDDPDRDGSVAGIPVLGQLASQLADAGFIVVRYDRRGVGQSGGRVETATLGDHADDVRAAVKALRQRKDVDGKRVAVVGYDEAGAIAMEAARRDEDIRALALLAAPGVSGSELVLEQQARALEKLNIPDAERQAKIALQRKINEAAVSGKDWAGVPPAMRRQAEDSWFQSFLAFDPAKVMPKIRQPILVVSAGLDKQVGPAHAQKLEALARARKKAAGQAVKRVDVPGINHLLVPATTGEVDEYAALPDKMIGNQVPAAIAGWLKGLWARN